ncbi:c-5 sterol desaturase [Entomortierella lignicola]|nr:c-5 sterol desaturase [Entomortierella lignicola]
MDFILDKADEYVFNSVYTSLPAIPIPDLVAGIAAIPKWSDFNSLLSNSSSSPLQTITSIARHVISSTLSANMTLNALPTDNIFRQFLTLVVITYFGGLLMYFSFAVPSYFLVFDRNHMKHPKFLKNQIQQEIIMSMRAVPGIALVTAPWLLGEVRGWSKVYTHIHAKDAILSTYTPPTSVIQQSVAAAVATATGFNSTAAVAAAASAAASSATAARAAKFGPFASLVEPFLDGWGYVAFSIVAFLLFTDFGIYWIHRWLHHPLIYKRLHKPHHKWIVPTPFASHAFHFLDGYSQSVPYHLFVYLVPMQKFIYLFMFASVNFWSVLIHDGEYLVSNPVINSAAHHAVHHLYFNYNYGQYSTLWDRLGGSYRKPDDAMYNRELRMDKSVWKKQAIDVDNFDDNGKPTASSDPTYKTGPHSKGTKAL